MALIGIIGWDKVPVPMSLMERQAMRRVENDSLTDEQIEELGLTLMRLEEKMEELKIVFGLENEELTIELGPLGKLI